jgi:hypothetical protein
MHDANQPFRVPLAGIAAAALGGLLALAAAVPVFAKEGMEARLDAPIARDTPPGTELLVGMTVTYAEGSEVHPVEGSPIYLRLTGPGGDSSVNLGRQGKSGHYTMRITVPAGGIASVEVGIRGTSDLAITVVGEPLMAGGITPLTAQAAPAITPAPTFAAPAGVQAGGPADEPATAPAVPETGPVAGLTGLAVLVVVTMVAVTGLVVAARKGRGVRNLGSGPTRGA